MAKAQGTAVALQLVLPHDSAPLTLHLKESGDTGIVWKAEKCEIFLPGEQETLKCTLLNIVGFNRGFCIRVLIFYTDGQQVSGVEAGAGFPLRDVLKMAASERREEKSSDLTKVFGMNACGLSNQKSMAIIGTLK